MQATNENLPIGTLVADLGRETSTLIRKELELAKTELVETATTAGRPVKLLAFGGAIANAGAVGVLAAATIALREVLPLWLAALAGGLVFSVLGLIVIQVALRNIKEIRPVPTQALQAMKENKLWLKQQIR